MNNTAIITNIQHYTIHDGPGIRTEIFFKGCTLHCPWCSNPETINKVREIGVYPSKCMTKEKCSWCIKVCPLEGKPLVFSDDGLISKVNIIDRCIDCFACADECPNHAIKIWGDIKTLDDLMSVIKSDKDFYDRTNGGVTLNGGEVLVQWEFARELLKQCKADNINTCVETALNVPWEHAESVFEYTDLVITDIKHMDRDIHKKLTGVSNDLILSNIEKTARMGKKLVIRTPVIAGYNNSEENIRATAEFICNNLERKIIAYQLLPFRRMGTEKYNSLLRPYPFENYKAPEREEWEADLLHLEKMLKEEYGLPAVAGSSKKLDIVL